VLGGAAIAVLLSGCFGTVGPQQPTPTPTAAPSTPPRAESGEPANVGDTKLDAIEYYESGAYFVDLAAVTEEAEAYLDARVADVERPAIVFDVDDTLLSTWEVIRADDFGRVIPGPCDALPSGPCGWREWDLQARAPALPPSLELYEHAQELGVTIFLITGRDEGQRDATQRNLEAIGYTGWAALIMTEPGSHYESAADYKTPHREAIEAMGYTIVANVGDQPSDLAGGHAEQTFKLPNPFYRIP
jgi:acid phosphatase